MGAFKLRTEIEDRHKWGIDAMYPEAQDFEAQMKVAKVLMEELLGFKGHCLDSQDQLKGLLQTQEQLSRLVENLFVYAHMKKDEDNGDSAHQVRYDRAMALSVEAGSVQSFIEPELLAGDQEVVMEMLKGDGFLEQYRFTFEKMFRQKAHKLSEKEERLLAMNGEVAAAPQHIFSMLNNADLKFPKIQNEKGEWVELTKGNFIPFMESSDRSVRKAAFEGFYSSFIAVKNTIAATHISSIKKDIFYAKARQYDSALLAGLDDEHVDQKVYEQLIEAVHDRVDLMHRYLALRKKMLQLDELHAYDLYAPLVGEVNKNIPYDEAVEMVLEGLSVLGDEYSQALKAGLAEKWVDVYETEGKTSGAYSWGTYDSKPYVLLNYQGTTDHVFTLAHELGHSMHSYLSNTHQTYPNAAYSIFVAEVASTVNEALLMKAMLKKTTDKKERMALLNHFMDQFKGTVYRQTMFAEFEKWTHEQFEAGNALSQEDINRYYQDLNRLYFGAGIVLDNALSYEWMRIPHFYNAFYVYKYATGFSAAMAIADKIEKEGKPAVDAYLQFLKSGGSNYPIENLKIAGVDMTEKAPIVRGLSIFEALLDEMETLMDGEK